MTDNTFTNLSAGIMASSEQFSLWLLRKLRAISNRVIRDPAIAIDVRAETAVVVQRHENYISQANSWVDEELPVAYKRGLEKGNASGKLAGATAVGTFSDKGILLPGLPGMNISDKAAKILEKYPGHHTMYSVFQQAAYQDFAQTRLPIVREYQDRIRRISVQASEVAYREADTFTRREMSQRIMTDLADEGVTGMRYSDGRTVKLDSYAEMVARTQTGNASRQAHLNRMQEYNLDLVQISQHYPCSPMCIDWQGKVYSISDNSSQYPSLETAINGGLYHSSCKHFQSGYIPGTSKLPDPEMTVTRNKEQYAAQNTQRHHERQIKHYKRREAAALTDSEKVKAKQKIEQWQARQREHIDSNDFLRRAYSREQL